MINPSNSPRALLFRVALLVLLLLATGGLRAETPISIFLTGANEVPSVVSSATATGQFTVLPDRSLSGSIKITGMVPTMAHIHEAPVGKNGPAIITLSKSPDESYAVPGGARLSEAQYKSYATGNLYVNVHSAQYPDGEIRGQLLGKPMRLAN